MADGCELIFASRVRGQKPAMKKWARILQTALALLLGEGISDSAGSFADEGGE